MTAKQKEHRWFAALWERMGRGKRFREWRERTAGGAKGRVLEIGIGAGHSIPFYRDIEALVAIEPDPAMWRYLEPRLASAPFPVEGHPIGAEALPFPDASFDTVVASLVYCTVPDAAKSLAEVRRVLKPGGELRFVEHVRAGGAIGVVQDLITPAWRWIGAGCHPNRRTEEAIRAAGFEIVEIERQGRAVPHILGVARVPA